MLVRDDETVDLPTRTGPMRTHLLRPGASGRYPGVVLYSEIFQVTAPIRRLAAMVAGHGFVVAVPEVFHEFESPGTVLSYSPQSTERGNELKYAKELAAYDSDAKAVVSFLATHDAANGKVGALGVCLGGHLAFRAALEPMVSAAACFYATDLHSQSLGKGKHDDSLARAKEIRGEVLFVWGRQDPHVPPEGRARIHDAVSQAGMDFTWHEFNAQHAFLRDEGHRYDPALARISHALIFELFERRLR